MMTCVMMMLLAHMCMLCVGPGPTCHLPALGLERGTSACLACLPAFLPWLCPCPSLPTFPLCPLLALYLPYPHCPLTFTLTFLCLAFPHPLMPLPCPFALPALVLALALCLTCLIFVFSAFLFPGGWFVPLLTTVRLLPPVPIWHFVVYHLFQRCYANALSSTSWFFSSRFFACASRYSLRAARCRLFPFFPF